MRSEYLKDFRFNSVFTRILLVLILITIIPVLLANWIIYKKSTFAIEKQIKIVNMEMLWKTVQMVDLIFNEAERTMRQLAQDANVIQAVIAPHINTFSRNVSILNTLKNVVASNQYIESVYFYSITDGTVFHSNGNIYPIDSFLDQAWVDLYQQKDSPFLYLDTRPIANYNNNQSNCITLISNIPFLSGSKLGAIVVNLREDSFYSSTAGTTLQNDGILYAVNSSGVIVSHSVKDELYQSIKGLTYSNEVLQQDHGFFQSVTETQRMYCSFLPVERNNWKFIYIISANKLFADSNTVTLAILVVSAVYILFSLFLSLMVTRGIYNPIENLLNLISQTRKYSYSSAQKKIRNEYDFLGQAYSHVVDENRDMEKRLEQLKPIIQERLFFQLIHGINTNKKDIEEKLEFLGIEYQSNNFMVIIIQIDDYEEMCEKFYAEKRNIFKVSLIDTLEKVINKRHRNICLEMDPDKIAVIITFKEKLPAITAHEMSLALAEDIKEQIALVFPFTVTLGVGRLHSDINNLNQSYLEAVEALRYTLYQGKNQIIDISEIESQTSDFSNYNSEKEKAIISNIKVGDRENVEHLISDFILEIQRNGAVRNKYLEQTFMNILSSMVEVIMGIGMKVDDIFGKEYDLFHDLSKQETLTEIESWLKVISIKIIDAISAFHDKRIDRNVERIVEYIDSHLEKEISLSEVAELVGFSPTYVSKIFKDNLKKKYVDYLSEKRIEKARAYLKETNFSIKEVGFKVGFNNIQSFLRTFKKYEGMTPKQFREKG